MCINFNGDKEYFASKRSSVFLPICIVRRDTSRNNNKNSDDKNAPSHKIVTHVSTNKSKSSNPYNLELGSAVHYLGQYGVIKWIGALSGDTKIYAGVEMVRHVI